MWKKVLAWIDRSLTTCVSSHRSEWVIGSNGFKKTNPPTLVCVNVDRNKSFSHLLLDHRK